MKIKTLKNQIKYREQYEKYVKQMKKQQMFNAIIQLEKNDILIEEDYKIKNTFDTIFANKNIIDNFNENYQFKKVIPKITVKLNILSFNEWLKNIK